MRFLPTACLALLLLPAGLPASAAPQEEAVLRSSDLRKLGKPVSDWFEAKIAGETTKQLQAREKLLAAVEAVGKSHKDQDPLALVADWEKVLGDARSYPRSGFRKGRAQRNEDNPAAPFVLWVPKAYNASKKAWPLLYLLDDAGADPEATVESLTEEIKDGWIVVARDMKSISEAEFLDQGALRLAGLPQAVQTFRVDRNRMAILGVGSSASLAGRLASALPHFFSAVALIGEGGRAGLTEANLAQVAVSEQGDLASACSWLLEQSPRNPYPLEFSFSPRYPWAGRSYWVQATEFETPDTTGDEKPASLAVKVDRESNTIQIDARHVRQVTLYLNDRIVDLGRKVTILRNGVAYEIEPRRTIGVILDNFVNTLDAQAVVTAMVRQLDLPEQGGSQ